MSEIVNFIKRWVWVNAGSPEVDKSQSYKLLRFEDIVVNSQVRFLSAY